MKSFLIAAGLFLLGIPWLLTTDLIWNAGYEDFADFFGKHISAAGLPAWCMSIYGTVALLLPMLFVTALPCWFIGWLKKYYMLYALAFIAGTLVPWIDICLHFSMPNSALSVSDCIEFCVYSALCAFCSWLGHRYKFRNTLKKGQGAFPVQPA